MFIIFREFFDCTFLDNSRKAEYLVGVIYDGMKAPIYLLRDPRARQGFFSRRNPRNMHLRPLFPLQTRGRFFRNLPKLRDGRMYPSRNRITDCFSRRNFSKCRYRVCDERYVPPARTYPEIPDRLQTAARESRAAVKNST